MTKESYADKFITSAPRYLTKRQVNLILDAAGNERDRLLYHLIYMHGLRVSEAVMLDTQDILVEERRIHIRRVKGGAASYYPMWSTTLDLLRGWSWDQIAGPLFISRTGGRLSINRVQCLFRKLARKSGVFLRRGLGVHALRHSIAVHLLDAGATLEFVQHWLGHRSILSTQMYARVSSEKVRREMTVVERSGAIAIGGNIQLDIWGKR